MSFNETHPELRDGEVFLSNFSTENNSFNNCRWKTKRLGVSAYDKEGNLLGQINRLRPAFVQKKELDEVNIKLNLFK